MGLDLVEFLMELEDTYNFTITDQDVMLSETVGQLHCGMVCTLMDQEQLVNPEVDISSEAVRDKIFSIISEITGMKKEKIPLTMKVAELMD